MRRHLLSFKLSQSYFSLPLWQWPLPGDYNGSSGAERIRGWQLRVFLARNGWLKPPARCSITGARDGLVYHSEDYLRPWEPLALTRGAHIRLHQRFRRPEGWRHFLLTEGQSRTWAGKLPCDAVPEQPRGPDLYIASIQAEAPLPSWVIVPWAELFRDDMYMKSLPPMSDDEMRRFISSNQWTFAKSMPHIPHEYVTKRRCADPVLFERMVLQIRRVGVARKFGNSEFVYLDFDGRSYWSMGAVLSATSVLNRTVAR